MAISGIDVKMAVTGISQFKNNISQAKQNMKTLDAQLNLTEKQFKATGDAETYMQQKSEQLKAKLAEQKTVAENAEKAMRQMKERGVDEGSKAFQDMIRTLANAKSGMYDIETELGNIGEAAGGADVEVNSLNGELSSIGKNISVSNVTDALDTITGGMEAVMAKAIDIGRRIINATLGAGSWADELHTMATQWGISDEELQKMQMTADIIDVEASTILQAKQKLNKVIGQDLLTEGSGVAEMLETLGLSNVISTDPEERFWQIGEAIMNMGNESIQEAAATKLMGKSWRELIPLFETGREEYEKIKESWHVVSDDQIESLTKMDDEYKKLENEFETVKRQFEATFAESITPVLETLNGLMSEFNEYLQTPEGKEMMQSLGDAVSSLVSDLAQIDPESTVENIQKVIQKIQGGFRWITENKNHIINTMKGIFIGWGSLKLIGGALTLYQLVTGIKGLTTAKAAASGASVGTSWAGAFAKAAMKAAPFLAFLYTLMNPSPSSDELGNSTIYDPDGNMTEEGKQALEGFEEQKNSAEAQFHGKWSPSEWQAMQDYWDKYKTGSATAEDWEVIKAKFGQDENKWNRFLEIAQEMYGLNKGLNDLPEYLFREPEETGSNGKTKTEEFNENVEKSIENGLGKGLQKWGVYLDKTKVGDVMAPVIDQMLADGVFGQGP